MSMSIEQLCHGLPTEFAQYLDYVRYVLAFLSACLSMLSCSHQACKVKGAQCSVSERPWPYFAAHTFLWDAVADMGLACRSLAFDEAPKYSHLRRLFRDLFCAKGFHWDYNFDWAARLAEQQANALVPNMLHKLEPKPVVPQQTQVDLAQPTDVNTADAQAGTSGEQELPQATTTKRFWGIKAPAMFRRKRST